MKKLEIMKIICTQGRDSYRDNKNINSKKGERKMKKILVMFLVLCFMGVSVAGYAADYSWNKEFGASLGRDGRSWSGLFLKNVITFEGATSNAYETTLSITDPTADRTITVPDYTGAVPIIIAQTASATSIVGATSTDVAGSSLTLAANWLSAGKTLKYTVAGVKTSANAAMKIYLYLKDATVMTLTASGSTASDYVADFTLTELTDYAHQKIFGCLRSHGFATCDYASATKDVSGSTTVKVIIESQHASDGVTAEYTVIEHWVK